jgi:hypothetical protein
VSTVNSSAPEAVFSGFGASIPRMFVISSTLTSSQVADTGRWAAMGYGSRNLVGPGMRVGDLVCHAGATASSSKPGYVSWHQVVGSTADQASTLAATGWAANFNLTLSLSTST